MNVKHSLSVALFSMVAQACMAQAATPDVLTTSGGYSSNATASLSWTIGEPVIETGASSSNFLTQGYQQPIGIVITSVENTQNNSGISAYPNPVISSVFITSTTSQPLRVDVMDLEGRRLCTKNLPANGNNQVDMKDYANGMYLLKVYTTEGQLLQTLKVEKVK